MLVLNTIFLKFTRKFLLKTCMPCLLFIFSFFFLTNSCFAQLDTLRIVTYNLLNFPHSLGSDRIPHFRKIIQSINPDILVVQELESAAGQQTILKEVLNYYNSDVYDAVPFNDGPDSDNGLFYKKAKVVFTAARQLPTDTRNITEYILFCSDIRVFLYSAHLKASSGELNEKKRLNEATVLRNRLNILPESTNFVVVGDFNFYNSSEPGFIKLTEIQNGNHGNLIDPINRLGYWHNNSGFRDIHTQSTRTTAFGDGSTGGLDDRFDLMLCSSSVMTKGGVHILPETYKAYGNDGRHFNMAINLGFNTAVPDSIADALHQASDHLPVFADFVFGTVSSVNSDNIRPTQFNIYQNYPNPFNSETSFRVDVSEPTEVKILIYNLNGILVSSLSNSFAEPGSYYLNWNGKDLNGVDVSSGIYIFSSSHKNFKRFGKMILVK